MRNKFLFIFALSIILFSCSTGKKALQKGNYYTAITKAVERLKSDPDNTKAQQVLKDGYPMAIQWSQEEIDYTLSANQAYKWEHTIDIMHQVNNLSEKIRHTPAARKIVPDPKSYASEMNLAYEKAAQERYEIGVLFLNKMTREDAKTAYANFVKSDQFVPGYSDVSQKLMLAKEMATLIVVVEAITVRTRAYKLSSEFFYNQVFQYLNEQFPQQSFVNILSPQQAEDDQINQPDYIVQMEFYDFSVGNLIRREKEESLVRREKVAINDTTEVTRTYKAKLKTFSDEVISNGRLSYKIIEFKTDKLIRNQLIPGSFSWLNEYAIYVGDKKALNEKQFSLTKNSALPPPQNQDLFIEFTRPIYDQLTVDLNHFFKRYK